MIGKSQRLRLLERLHQLQLEVAEIQVKIINDEPDLRNLAAEIDHRFQEAIEIRWRLRPWSSRFLKWLVV